MYVFIMNIQCIQIQTNYKIIIQQFILLDNTLIITILGGAILYPYVLENSSLHFFDDYGVLFTNSNNFILNDVETYLIQKFTGDNSIDDIILEVAHEIDSNDYTEIRNIIMTFINDKSELLFLSSSVHKVELKKTGEGGSKIPLVLTFSLTNKCTEECVHCFKNCSINKTDFIDFDTIMETLEYLKGKSIAVQLTGGEPMLHDKFFPILKYCSQNFETSITTNGTLINSSNAIYFKDAKAVQISLYSHIKAEHDSITGVNGSFDRTINGISALLKEGVHVIITTILNKTNMDSMEIFAKFCCEIGIKSLRYGLFLPFGRGTVLKDAWYISEEHKEHIGERISALSEKFSHKLSIQTWKDEDKDAGIPESYKCFRCGGGLFTWSVSERGIIKPCEFLDDGFIVLADLKKQRICDVVKNISLDNLPTQLLCLEHALNKNSSSIIDVCSQIKSYYINNCCSNKLD